MVIFRDITVLPKYGTWMNFSRTIWYNRQFLGIRLANCLEIHWIVAEIKLIEPLEHFFSNLAARHTKMSSHILTICLVFQRTNLYILWFFVILVNVFYFLAQKCSKFSCVRTTARIRMIGLNRVNGWFSEK